MTQTRAVIAHNVIAMHAEPGDRSEHVSQAILGETVAVLQHADDFARIESPDGYRGWSVAAHLAILETGEQYPNPARAAMVSALILPVYRQPSSVSERITLLTLGTTVEPAEGDLGAEFVAVRMPRGDIGYVEGRSLIVPEYPPVERLGPNLAVVARGMIGVPYLWGGRTPFGIDCSGFVQRVYWLCGQTIPRDAYLQAAAEQFTPVEKSALRPGDLVFFSGDRDPCKRGITHVGLALAEGRFIHASSHNGVAISTLTEAPYNRQFWGARRLIGA